jgi:hypothetical protein
MVVDSFFQLAAFLTFLLGCPVWVYSNDKPGQADPTTLTIQEGTVPSVSINMATKVVSYEVEMRHSTLVVTED